MAITLKGGHTTNDPRLDRLPEVDERRRLFPVRRLLEVTGAAVRPVRSYTWRVYAALDQGSEGACVGFAWAHELAARPYPVKGITDTAALWIYRRAQQLDDWPGEAYSGTSVLAGAKATTERGGLLEYRWADTLADVRLTVAWLGPVVLGLNWYTGMMKPDSDGRIRPTGDIEGGHGILLPRVRGPKYSLKRHRNTNWLWNSWGASNGWPWGWLTDDDLERLLHEDGEACVPVVRNWGRA